METVLTYKEIIKETGNSVTVILNEDYSNKKLCIPKSKVPRVNYNRIENKVKIEQGFLNWLLKQNGI